MSGVVVSCIPVSILVLQCADRLSAYPTSISIVNHPMHMQTAHVDCVVEPQDLVRQQGGSLAQVRIPEGVRCGKPPCL